MSDNDFDAASEIRALQVGSVYGRMVQAMHNEVAAAIGDFTEHAPRWTPVRSRVVVRPVPLQHSPYSCAQCNADHCHTCSRSFCYCDNAYHERPSPPERP